MDNFHQHEVPLLWGPRLSRLVSHSDGHSLSFGMYILISPLSIVCFVYYHYSIQSSVKAKLLGQHVARHLSGQEIDVRWYCKDNFDLKIKLIFFCNIVSKSQLSSC